MGVILKTFAEVTVSVAGTAVPLSATPYFVSSAVVQSISNNTGTQYIGDSTVTSSNGIAFGPGENAEVEGPASPRGHEQYDLSKVYVNASVNNTKFRVLTWIRG